MRDSTKNLLTLAAGAMLASGLGCASGGGSAADAGAAAAGLRYSGEPINTVCPIGGHEPEGEPILVGHDGYTVLLCCSGCEMAWDDYSDEEKAEVVATLMAGG